MSHRYLFAVIAATFAGMQFSPAIASAPQCYPYSGAWYCQYEGRVRQAYVNAGQQVILYFDTPMNIASATSVGANGVTVSDAAIYNMASNPEFGKALFAAMLAAQARGATVSVQMNSTYGGYLVMDRIWVNE
jgi:hypothetical protein